MISEKKACIVDLAIGLTQTEKFWVLRVMVMLQVVSQSATKPEYTKLQCSRGFLGKIYMPMILVLLENQWPAGIFFPGETIGMNRVP